MTHGSSGMGPPSIITPHKCHHRKASRKEAEQQQVGRPKRARRGSREITAEWEKSQQRTGL